MLPSKQTIYTYSHDGDLDTVAYPDAETWTYTSDSVHELHTIESGAINVTFDSVARGILGTKTFGNGTVSTFVFSDRPDSPTGYLPTTWTNSFKINNSNQNLSESYEYDANSQLHKVDNDTQQYDYDGAHRLQNSRPKSFWNE